MEPLTWFGLWLKERRKQLDLTQADLARCVGCSAMTIRKIEADERRPSRQIAKLLANCLEITSAERPTFLKVARAELRVDRLGKVVPASPAGRTPVSPAPGPTSPVSDTHPPETFSSARPAAGAAPPHNLPLPLTPLLGREHELANLARLLQEPECRLLTLVGPGGIGKTCLAIAAAANLREVFADGVYFVSLAPLSAPEFMLPTMASALAFTFYGPADLDAQFLNYLREKFMLLVLDNFEQLLPSAQDQNEAGLELLVKMLQAAPAVKLLVTSRERLHLQREWVFEVQGLPIPPPAQSEGLEAYSAVALFLQRARRVRADFSVAAGEQEAIGHNIRQRIRRAITDLSLNPQPHYSQQMKLPEDIEL